MADLCPMLLNFLLCNMFQKKPPVFLTVSQILKKLLYNFHKNKQISKKGKKVKIKFISQQTYIGYEIWW